MTRTTAAVGVELVYQSRIEHVGKWAANTMTSLAYLNKSTFFTRQAQHPTQPIEVNVLCVKVGRVTIWDSLFKAAEERRNGRIHTWPGHWRLKGSNDGTPGEYTERFDRDDDLGRPMELVTLKCIRCDWDKWESDYAKSDKWYWIPWRICKKCEHYIKGERKRGGIRYPCCRRKRSRTPKQDAAKDVLSAFSKAVDDANQIIGNR